MDDLKTYAKSESQQTGLLNIVKTFSDDIKMEFGLDKCAKATFKRGKLTETFDIQLDTDTCIKELEQENTYKYLGVDEGDGIQHAKMKEKVRKEYYRRVRMVLKTELNAANRFEAINTLAIPVETYSLNIIDWKMSEIKRLDKKTRKLLPLSKMHNPKADVDRLYLPRNAGGSGLIQLEATYKTTTIGLDTYLKNTDDALMKLVQEHDGRKKLYSIQTQAEQFNQKLDLTIPDKRADQAAIKYAKRTKQMARNKTQEKLTKQWEDKALHGRYPKRIKEADVVHHKTKQWLKSSGLKSETEGFIIAAQDQSLATRLYYASIIKDGSSPLCRMCNKYDETINHIVSGCPELAKTEYIHRHDKAASYIHWKVCHN